MGVVFCLKLEIEILDIVSFSCLDWTHTMYISCQFICKEKNTNVILEEYILSEFFNLQYVSNVSGQYLNKIFLVKY